MAGKRKKKGAADNEVSTQADTVVRFLPKPFLDSYEGLLSLVFGDGVGQGMGALGTVVPETVGVDEGRGFESKVPLRGTADGAIEVRKSVDRRLRALAREVGTWLESGEVGKTTAPESRCIRCGRFGDAGWTYCAHCSFPVGGAILYRCECGPTIHQVTIPAIIHCARVRGVLPERVLDRQVQVEFMAATVDLAGTVKL